MTLSKMLKETSSLFFIALCIFAFKSTFVCNYTVPTGSMKPTIEPWDKLIVNKMAYDLRIPFTKKRLFQYADPKRGEIIVFECPYDESITFVKRLIALPGDHVEVESGFIKVNGKALEISVTEEEKLREILREGGFYEETHGSRSYTVRRVPSFHSSGKVSVIVPQGQYFAMGDNRDESDDSRRWGFVPRENIWGRASFVYFALDWAEWTQWPKISWHRIGTSFS